MRPAQSKPVTVRARGTDPDGDRIVHEWRFVCLEPLSTAIDAATVQLKPECVEGQATLTWTDERGESVNVEWLLQR